MGLFLHDTSQLAGDSEAALTETSTNELVRIIDQYAQRGLRCLGISYRDLPAKFDFKATTPNVENSDITDAFVCEREFTFCALVGILDPRCPEVLDAIKKCNEAGIDVRFVTGDSPNTNGSIAYQADILNDFHFVEESCDKIVVIMKPNVMMEVNKLDL